MRTRKDRAPNGMCVQDCASIEAARDGEMKQGFRGRPPITLYHVRRIVDLQKLPGRKSALVQSCRSNGQPQRLAGNHRAEVSTCAQNPAALVKTLSNFRQTIGNLRETASVLAGLPALRSITSGTNASLGFTFRHARHSTTQSKWMKQAREVRTVRLRQSQTLAGPFGCRYPTAARSRHTRTALRVEWRSTR